LVALVPYLAEHNRPAAKPAGCKGALARDLRSWNAERGGASLAFGEARAARNVELSEQ